MSEAEKRLHRCCFTGHRPEALHRSEIQIKADLEQKIRQAIADGFTVFISGMARGVDIWAAETVLDLRREGLPIRLICASPYRGFESRWSDHWQKRYRTILGAADLVRFICPGYCPSCFQTRNQWMVDHAAKVIAVFNGHPGGTKNTIDYAQRNDIPISYIRG